MTLGLVNASAKKITSLCFFLTSEIKYSQNKQLEDLDWNDVDVVIESTGKFKLRYDLQKHLKAGAKRVILSAPPVEDEW